MAIFKDWDYKIGLIDLTWGGFLFLISTYLFNNVAKKTNIIVNPLNNK